MVRGAAPRGGDGGGVDGGGVVPGDAGGGDVGAGAAGRAASSYSARGGCDGHRSEPRPDRAVRRRAHRLPRSCRCGAAGAGRRTHARSDAVIRRTKIVVTLGPATATPERIAGLIDAGANVIRVNASHGTPELRAGWIAATRRAAEAADAPVAILVDLQGPRIRVGELAQPRALRAGEQVVFAPEEVARADDLAELRQLVPPVIKLVAKIEKAAALDDLDGILRVSDAVMVARGDLGVELPFEEVPVVQKRLIREANRHGKPVITATQMLESMVHNPRPTRAEASDVANAILDGTDAGMLSAETAVGAHPFEAVRAMARHIREMVRDLLVKRGYAQAGDRIVMTAGVPWEVSGATNLLKVEVV